MSDLDRVLERVRQNRAARAKALTPVSGARAGTDGNARDPHAVGARVFDTVTGQVGEVVGGASENVVVPVTQRHNG